MPSETSTRDELVWADLGNSESNKPVGRPLLLPCMVVVDCCSLWFRRRGSSYFRGVVLLVFRLRIMFCMSAHATRPQ